MESKRRYEMESPTHMKLFHWDKEAGTYLSTSDILEVEPTQPPEAKGKGKSQAPKDLFLKGPIPWDWLVRASALPGKALIIGFCLWRLKGATGRNTVFLSNTELKPFGIDRGAKSRAIAALKEAALIEVDPSPGRWSTITLLDE
jgi:hypothetical protein